MRRHQSGPSQARKIGENGIKMFTNDWHVECSGYGNQDGEIRATMLSHCENSQCSKPFLRLREGRLFLVETPGMTRQGGLTIPKVPLLRKPPQRVEHFWLCDRCASVWTLIQNGTLGIALVPLAQPAVPGGESQQKAYREVT